MKLPFILRRRHDAELAELRRRDQERRALARQLAEMCASNIRLLGRNRELSRRLDSAHDANLGELGDVAALEDRALLAEASVRQLEKDVTRLQARLDDAVGIPQGGVIRSSGPCQPGYRVPKVDAP